MIRPETLQKLNPDPDALLIALSELVDDSMLEEIANADYGMETEEHLAQLRRIRDEHIVPSPMRWNPGEVLSLVHFRDPDQKYPDRDDENLRGHIIRAFACAVLLRSNAEVADDNYHDGQNQTLVQLLASLPVIGESLQVEARRFVAWRIQDLRGSYEDAPFYVLALLVLILRTHADLTSAELQEIIDYLFVLERQIRLEFYYSMPEHSEPWLLGLTYFDQRHHVWKLIGKEIGTLAANYRDTGLKPALLDISRRLTDESTPQS